MATLTCGPQTYWSGKGKHQKLNDLLIETMGKLIATVVATGVCSWDAFLYPEHTVWAIFNGFAGIYYGHYNDGDKPSGVIDNNRVHGFGTLDAFRSFCEWNHAPKSALWYLRFDGGFDAELERAMDDVICFAATELDIIVVNKRDRDRDREDSDDDVVQGEFSKSMTKRPRTKRSRISRSDLKLITENTAQSKTKRSRISRADLKLITENARK